MSLSMPAGSTVEDALNAASPVVDEYRAVAPTLKVGVFGESKELTEKLADGDRLELLRPLRRSPTERRRQRLKRATKN